MRQTISRRCVAWYGMDLHIAYIVLYMCIDTTNIY